MKLKNLKRSDGFAAWIKGNDLVTAKKELECDSPELNQMMGYNSALEEAGEIEVEVDISSLAKIIQQNQFETCEVRMDGRQRPNSPIKMAKEIATALPEILRRV